MPFFLSVLNTFIRLEVLDCRRVCAWNPNKLPEETVIQNKSNKSSSFVCKMYPYDWITQTAMGKMHQHLNEQIVYKNYIYFWTIHNEEIEMITWNQSSSFLIIKLQSAWFMVTFISQVAGEELGFSQTVGCLCSLVFCHCRQVRIPTVPEVTCNRDITHATEH